MAPLHAPASVQSMLSGAAAITQSGQAATRRHARPGSDAPGRAARSRAPLLVGRRLTLALLQEPLHLERVAHPVLPAELGDVVLAGVERIPSPVVRPRGVVPVRVRADVLAPCAVLTRRWGPSAWPGGATAARTARKRADGRPGQSCRPGSLTGVQERPPLDLRASQRPFSAGKLYLRERRRGRRPRPGAWLAAAPGLQPGCELACPSCHADERTLVSRIRRSRASSLGTGRTGTESKRTQPPPQARPRQRAPFQDRETGAVTWRKPAQRGHAERVWGHALPLATAL